jgi:hypothetical protein
VELVVGCDVVLDVAEVMVDADVLFEVLVVAPLVVLFVKVVFADVMNEGLPEPDDANVSDPAETRVRM